VATASKLELIVLAYLKAQGAEWVVKVPLSRFALMLLLLLAASLADAQQLEARRWASLPVGANFVGLGYGYSTGSLLFDPALPVDDADSNTNVVGAGYTRVLKNFGRQARIDISVPYAWGDFAGTIDQKFAETTRSGFADPALQYSINLYGGRALSGKAFLSERTPTSIGAAGGV
jgi:hypothetical protein